jgi:hypothetical protein
VISGCIEEELYKDAFLYTLTLFESLYKRGALGKALKVCEEASRLLATPFCHAQLRQVWDDLRAQVGSQALTASQLLEARLYFVRHWSVPAARLPMRQTGDQAVPEASSALILAELESAAEPESVRTPPVSHPPERGETPLAPLGVPEQLADGGYEEALERYDRQLIAAALDQCGGRFRAASRLLGISRNTLRAKMKRYGLREQA